MAAPQSSVSSQNQAVQGPRLASSAGRRTGRVAVHESYDLASDASIKPPASPLRSVTVSIGITSDVVRSNSPLPKIASSTPIVHSSWIQRLKPSSHRCAAKDEPPIFSKDRVVCTHFTKDYSSCGRGLKKSTHHSRSASWPPHSSQSNATRQLALDVEEPACDSPEERYNAAPISSHLNHQYACVLSKNASQSSEAGSRTGSQQDCRKHFCPSGGFVPCSQLFSKGKDHRKPESCSGQQSQDHINEESKSKFLARFEQEKLHSRSQQVKNNNWGNFDGSFPIFSDFVSAPPLPVSVCGAGYSSGASADADADADASYCYAKPLAFDVLNGKEIDQSGFGKFDCRGENAAADVLREKEKLDKFGLILPYKEEAVQNGLSMGFKGAVKLNMPQARENFDLFKGAAGKAYLRSGFSTKRPDDPHLSNVNYQRPGARTTEDTTAQNFTPSGIGASRLKKYNLVTSQTPHSGEVGQASRSDVPITSLHEDAARVRIRENSLGDYWNSWVRLLEEQDHGARIKCRQLIAPSDYLTNFVADCLEVPQEQYLYSNEGASGRVDSQPHNKNSVRVLKCWKIFLCH
ncbi:hypothetical protein GOP47_0013352 [Adiantum capillus-veneris]|uniref:Uncharacterized protein n=1 Tax=Adiantum capillus-veneris TaxID=13818 RepID=A0A9D4UP18_ADICA|nr:hypothetical protein GOP47_0013352 [Adiantum capillus-veneris]